MQRLIVVLVYNLLLQQTYDTLIYHGWCCFIDTLSDTQHAWYMVFDLALFFSFFFQIQEPWGPGSETGLSSMHTVTHSPILDIA